MVRVLIVAKTRMAGAACVGGLILDTNQSIRLLRPGRPFQPGDTSFEVGHICDLEFERSTDIIPPHTEDVIVTGARYIGQQRDLRDFLLQRVQPWRGGLEQLFGGLLTFRNGKAYISQEKGIPNVSTGFWIPEKPLVRSYLNNKVNYCYEHGGGCFIPYVGFAEAIERIPAGALGRVSLARWFAPTETSEERCYLQLSGWYL